MPKLAVGTIIRVHGWLMLARLEEGDYKVSEISEFMGEPTYVFTKRRGKKRIVSHYCRKVDFWVGGPDIGGNRIEIVRQ